MWPSPLPFNLSQAALPCPQASPVPNGDTIEAKRLKDLQDLQEKEPPKKYRLTESMKNIFWQLYCLSNECLQLTTILRCALGLPMAAGRRAIPHKPTALNLE